ncbi:hypothetical protein STEG23_008866 [Scotinomys teguina]
MEQNDLYSLSQITNSLFIGNAVVANDKLTLFNNHISMVISASTEVVNMFFEDIEYVQVPVSDTPDAYLYDFFDSISDHIYTMEMRNGRVLLHCATGVSSSAAFGLAYLMKYHDMTLLDAHKWAKSCRSIIHPNNCLWEQLIHYEFKLFSKNTVRMIYSPIGLIPNIYEKEIHLMESI